MPEAESNPKDRLLLYDPPGGSESMGFWRKIKPFVEAAEHLHLGAMLLDLIVDWRVWIAALGGGVLTLFTAAYDGRSVTDVLLAVAVGVGVFAGMAVAVLVLWQKLKLRYVGSISEKGDAILEIIFDPTNPAKRFWSRESPRDDNGNMKPGVFWEYRVDIKNNSQKTVRNVSVTVEHIGQELPVRPVDAIFDKIRKNSCDLKPSADELVAIVRWPIPIIQAGMLSGPSALAYGPVKVTASADDVPPTVRVFQFDYQSEPMLFDSFETSFKSLREAAAELYGEIILTKLGRLTADHCSSEEEIWDAIGTMIINRGRVCGRRPGSSKIEEVQKGLFYSRLVGGAKIIRDNSTEKKTDFTDLQISRADLDAVIQNVKSIANVD